MDPRSLPQEVGFLNHVPDFKLIEDVAKGYAGYKNILIIGHGGSVTSFYGYYSALNSQAVKQVYFLSTTDPDYIYKLKLSLPEKETLVIVISKSGENITVFEALSQFSGYNILCITGTNSSLRAYVEKLGGKIINHPPIGGRFSGLTEVALLPAMIAGLDAEGIYDGAAQLYAQFGKDNPAWHAASVFWQLEQQGYTDVFMPFYSHSLFPMSALIVQLCHESFGKSGRGQTYFAHEGPESQHHTNQRFFGGPKNICGCFVTTDSFVHDTMITYPNPVHEVWIKSGQLKNMDQIRLADSMHFEADGTMEDARIAGIPFAHVEINGFNAQEIGPFTAFWQLFAVYSSVLRGVDPFNQPQVENSKIISFDKRLKSKGLL